MTLHIRIHPLILAALCLLLCLLLIDRSQRRSRATRPAQPTEPIKPARPAPEPMARPANSKIIVEREPLETPRSSRYSTNPDERKAEYNERSRAAFMRGAMAAQEMASRD